MVTTLEKTEAANQAILLLVVQKNEINKRFIESDPCSSFPLAETVDFEKRCNDAIKLFEDIKKKLK